jgi:hypothetical protein
MPTTSAACADVAGPWRLISLAEGGHAGFRVEESPEEADLLAADLPVASTPASPPKSGLTDAPLPLMLCLPFTLSREGVIARTRTT